MRFMIPTATQNRRLLAPRDSAAITHLVRTETIAFHAGAMPEPLFQPSPSFEDLIVAIGARQDRDADAGPREIAWLRLVPGETAPAVAGATALLATSDGRAIPIAFDDDGYALVPGVSPGEARLRLAPRLPSYSPPRP